MFILKNTERDADQVGNLWHKLIGAVFVGNLLSGIFDAIQHDWIAHDLLLSMERGLLSVLFEVFSLFQNLLVDIINGYGGIVKFIQ